MEMETKIKIFINLFLWLPVIWLAWNLIFHTSASKKRLQLLNEGNEILKKMIATNKDPAIDQPDSEGRRLREREKNLWDEYLGTCDKYKKMVAKM